MSGHYSEEELAIMAEFEPMDLPEKKIEPTFFERVGRSLRQHREWVLEITQDELAKDLKISRQTLGAMESGKGSKVSLETWMKAWEIMKVSKQVERATRTNSKVFKKMVEGLPDDLL